MTSPAINGVDALYGRQATTAPPRLISYITTENQLPSLLLMVLPFLNLITRE